MEVARLTTVFDGDTRSLDRAFDHSERRAQSFWSNVASNALANLATAALSRVKDAVTSIFTSAASFDSLKRGLTATAGSAEEAEKQLVRLREVAKLPGLGFREAIEGSIRLQSVKLNSQLAERSLAAFGNALATVGKGKADLDGVTLALTQIVSKGKVSAEEINQIAERVPQIRQAMKDAFGTADTEALQKMNIGPEMFIEKIVAQLEKLPQASGGAQNAMENFKDSLDQAFVTLGGPLLEPVANALNSIAPLLGQVAQNLSGFFGQIPQLASSFVSSLPESFKNAFGVIFGIVQSVGASIVGWFTQNLPLIKQTVTTILTAIGDFWANWGGTIKTIVTTAMNTVLGVIKLVLQAINGDWKGVWSTLTEVVRGVLNNLPAIIKGVLNFAVAAALALGKGIINAILEGLKALPGLLLEAIKGAFKAVWALASWLFEKGVELGGNIVKGIVHGIVSLGGFLGSAGRQMADTVINSARAKLQTQSPSKVFIEIGKNIAEGLALGIAAGTATAERAMERLLDATIRKFGTRERRVGTGLVDDARQSIIAALTHQADVLRDMAGGETALEAINKLLANPQVAAIVDERTAALLRFNAALEDTLKLTRERMVGPPPEMRATGDETRPRVFGPPADMRATGDETRPRRVLQDTVSESRRAFEQIASDLSATVGNAFRDLLDGNWRGMLEGMVTSACDAFARIAQQFIEQGIYKLINMLLSAVVGGISGGIGGSSSGGGFLSPAGEGPQMMASGGYLAPGDWAIAGEGGKPELVFGGSTGKTIFSNSDSKRMMGGGNTYVTINVPVARSSGYTQPKNRRQVADDIFRRLR